MNVVNLIAFILKGVNALIDVILWLRWGILKLIDAIKTLARKRW
jgi:hypothetical protein